MSFRSSRPATTTTVNTALRNSAWCSQCVVRCQPRVASLTILVVRMQSGFGSRHGRNLGGICEKPMQWNASAGPFASGSINPSRSATDASVCSRHAAATRSGVHSAIA